MTYSSIFRTFVYPFTQAIVGKPTLRVLKEIEGRQDWSAEMLREFQWDQLRAMLEHAYQNTPYYRRQFDAAGVTLADMRSPSDLTRLPVLTKADIRTHLSEMRAMDRNRTVNWVRTSGATGEPLIYPLDKLTEAHAAANAIRCRRWWGIEMGDPTALFWREFYSFDAMDAERFKRQCKNWVLNRRVFSVYDMSRDSMVRYYDELVRFRPKVILGYSSALFAFARYMQERMLDGQGLGVLIVVATAESIFPAQMRLLGKVFGCPVVNEYGATETGILAHECPGGAWHVMDDTVWLEVTPVEYSDTLGEVLVTHLANHAYPMIRYRIGDLAPLKSAACNCDRNLSTVGPVKGRSHDLLVTPNGRFVHGEFLVHVFDTIGQVTQFRVVQHAPERLEIQFVSPGRLDSHWEQYLRDRIAEFMGATVAVDLRPVAHIPQEESGKLRFIISHVAGAMLERTT